MLIIKPNKSIKSIKAKMIRSTSPSQVRTPEDVTQWASVIDFLCDYFPRIDRLIWQDRIDRNLVHWKDGAPITKDTPCAASAHIMYYREVKSEPIIPFEHDIIYEDDEIIVADKPHFLPVTPGGQYVNECLLNRIRKASKNEDIVPIHRLDKDTAGLIIFSKNPATRGLYAQLFANRQIDKSYHAVANVLNLKKQAHSGNRWCVKNRIERGTPGFTWAQGPGEVNAHSEIQLVDIEQDLGLFRLIPHTGKTHQLRLHMMSIGMPILNDRFYPKVMPFEHKNHAATITNHFQNPLQLLAFSLQFIDPVSGKKQIFQTKNSLVEWKG
jgi:tRNA pseudouridine32 synthase / 23S rRNA pseudouridine746 synthase